MHLADFQGGGGQGQLRRIQLAAIHLTEGVFVIEGVVIAALGGLQMQIHRLIQKQQFFLHRRKLVQPLHQLRSLCGIFPRLIFIQDALKPFLDTMRSAMPERSRKVFHRSLPVLHLVPIFIRVKLKGKLVDVGGKPVDGVQLRRGGFLRSRFFHSRGCLLRLLFLLGQVNALFLADLGKVLFDTGNHAASSFVDGIQTGAKLRQFPVLAVGGHIAEAVLTGFDAEILADHVGSAFRLDFLDLVCLGLRRFFVRVPGSGLHPLLFIIVQGGMGHLMDAGAYGLDLAHPLPDGNALGGGAEKAVHVVLHRLDGQGDRRSAPQSLHKSLVVLDIPEQVSGKLGQRFPFGLCVVKYFDRPESGDFDFLFLHHHLAVGVQHRGLGVRIELLFLDFLLVGCGGDNRNAMFPPLHMALKLLPLVVTGHFGRVRAL